MMGGFLFSRVGLYTAVKASNQVVNDSTALVSAGIDLTLPPGTYAINAWLHYNSDPSADIKFQFDDVSGSVTGAWGFASTDSITSSFGGTQSIAVGAGARCGHVNGTIIVTAAALLRVNWSQNTQQAIDSTLYAGSWLTAQRLV